MTSKRFQNNPCGSLWHRWDLHFHTPSSFEYEDMSVTNEQIVDRLVAEGVRVVAITDHHVINVKGIQELQRLGADRLTVLPGTEFRGDHGGKPVHYISKGVKVKGSSLLLTHLNG